MRCKIIVLILFQLLITHFLIADTHIPPGDVSGTWTIDGSPYIIDGHISVPVDSTLIIEPGVNIVFPEQNHFRVYGRLLAIGAESDTISFTASDTTDIFAGLYFCETDTSFQDSSKLKHCRFDPGCVGFSNSSRAIVKNCIVTNGYGIGFNNSSPIIDNVIVINNTSTSYGGGITCTDGSCPRLINVTVIGNSAMWGGGISCRFDSNPVLEGVTIMNNTAEAAGAGMFCAESSPILDNVLITENDGGGFCCTDESRPILNNVVISHNTGGICSFDSSPILTNIVINGNSGGGGAYFDGPDTIIVKNFEITENSLTEDIGGGVAVYGAKMIMVNGIIADNYAFDAGGIYGQEVHLSLINVTVCDNNIYDWGYVGGIGLNYYCKLDMTNCILWNNELNELVFMGPGCAWNINYCDIEDEISPGIGNISVDPQFADTLYHLSEDSPCIDAGNPDTMYYDIEDPENPGFALYPAMGALHNE